MVRPQWTVEFVQLIAFGAYNEGTVVEFHCINQTDRLIRGMQNVNSTDIAATICFQTIIYPIALAVTL